MHLKKGLGTLLIVLLLSNVQTYADNGSHFASQYQWTKASQMPKLIKAAKKRHNSRMLASYSSVDTSLMTKEYKNIVNTILETNDPDQIDGLINDLDKNYTKLPSDAKFLAAQLIMLKPFRGIVYRMIPMVSKERVSHSFLRNMVMSVASNMNIYLPNANHWEAGFKYITEPYKVSSKKVVSQFKDVKQALTRRVTSHAADQFQDFISKDVYEAMATAAVRIQKIKLDAPMIWDNRIAFGKDSFNDDVEETRFRKVGEAERLTALSSLHFGMHYLNYFVSYTITDSITLSKDIGKLYGIDGFANRQVTGVPSFKWVAQVQKDKYKKLGTLRSGDRNRMSLSFKHLQEGVRVLRLAREEVRNEPADRFFAINPVYVNTLDENIEKQFKHIECLTTNMKCPIRSAITGKTVVVNLKGFYENPPKDLKAFLPTGWNTANKTLSKHGVEYPNYSWGTPNDWNLSAYKTHIFPNIKNKKDIPEYAKSLRQSFGGEVFGAPMAIFVE